jgi:hypothetical protein
MILIGALVAVAAVVNAVVKHHYMSNGGEMMMYQLGEHVRWLLTPRNYIATEITYGISTTKGFHIVHLVLVAIVVKTGWRSLPSAVRMQTGIAGLITVPLFLAFCFRDELRNLSLLLMPFALLLCTTISVVLAQAASQRVSATIPQSREPVIRQGKRTSSELTPQP